MAIVAALMYVISDQSDHPLIFLDLYLNLYIPPLVMP